MSGAPRRRWPPDARTTRWGSILVAALVNVVVLSYWLDQYDPDAAQYIPRVFQTPAADWNDRAVGFAWDPQALTWARVPFASLPPEWFGPESGAQAEAGRAARYERAAESNSYGLGVDQRPATSLLHIGLFALFGDRGPQIGFALARTLLFDALFLVALLVTRRRLAALAVALAGGFNPYLISMTIIEPQTVHLTLLLMAMWSVAPRPAEASRAPWRSGARLSLAAVLVGVQLITVHALFAIVSVGLVMAWGWLLGTWTRLRAPLAFLAGVVVTGAVSTMCAAALAPPVGPFTRVIAPAQDGAPVTPAGAEAFDELPEECTTRYCLPERYRHRLLGGYELEFYGLLNWPFQDQLVRTGIYPLPFLLLIPGVLLIGLGGLAFGLGILGWIAPGRGRRALGGFLALWFLAVALPFTPFENLGAYKLFFSFRAWPPLLLGMGLSLARLTDEGARARALLRIPAALALAWAVQFALAGISVPVDPNWAPHMAYKRFPAQWVRRAVANAEAVRAEIRDARALPSDASLLVMQSSAPARVDEGAPPEGWVGAYPRSSARKLAALDALPRGARALVCAHAAFSIQALEHFPAHTGLLPNHAHYVDAFYHRLATRVAAIQATGSDVYALDQLRFACAPTLAKHFELEPRVSDGWHVLYRIVGSVSEAGGAPESSGPAPPR
jgi:hypothetical protein